MSESRAPISSSDLAGRTISHYKIEEQIGEGGMGVVYRAIDTLLSRPVAIKVLPDRCVKDAERRARFEREAKVLASLDHRNIGAIHGMETAGELSFLVLELIPGTTLAKRLAKDPPDLKESLEIARQMAEALEAAHEKGVVHRDLKPGNVMITPDGTVKVLDFGLAKALQNDTGGAETEATVTLAQQTESGVILGTAAYMSPEQARGRTVDRRTDIWAFGVVLYEMLARRRAFPGETLSDLLAAVLAKDPDWSALPPEVPPRVTALIRRCLQKDPRKRLRDIGDARLELEDAINAPPSEAETVAAKPARAAIFVLAGAIAGAVLAAAIVLSIRPSVPAPAVTRFSVPLGQDEIVAPLGGSVRLSDDGTHLAWVASDAEGRTQIYHRLLSDMKATALAGTASGYSPFFSFDGGSLAFVHGGSRTIKKLALSGGAPSLLCPYEASAAPGVWAPGDNIYTTIQYPGVLVKVASTGGTPQAVTTLDSKKEEVVHNRPVLLPGGKAILFTIGGGGMDSYDDARIAVQSLQTGQRKILIEGGMAPAYSPTGHLIYAHDGKLLAVPFDVNGLAVTGSPVPVVEGVFMCVSTGSAHYSLAANGTLAYAPGGVLGGARQLVWVDPAGKEEVVPAPARAYLHPRVSPDGKQLAVEVEGGPLHDFWTYDVARGIMSKVTTDGTSHWPVWSADGTRISFRRWVNGTFTMWWGPTDRSAPAERLTDIGRMQSPASWSPDGHVVAFTQSSPETGADVYVMDLADRKPRPFAQTRFAEGSPKFSPDGRWIAYTSNESGRNEIYVQAYPGPGAKIQVSVDGGTDAVWRLKGGELYYREGDKMMAVQVSTGGAFQAAKPRLLWRGRYAHGLGSQCGPPGTTSSNYDVTPDGGRFLMVRQDETAPAQINIVLNWTVELQRILNTKKL